MVVAGARRVRRRGVVVRPHDVEVPVGPGERLRERVLVALAVRRRRPEDRVRVDARRDVGADEHRRRERLGVVARVRLVDVRRPVAVVQRPGHVDAVLERAADVVVDRHVLLVEQAAARAGGVVVLGDRAAREVPRRAVVAGRAEDVERARLVRVRGDARAAVEHLAAEVRVALRVPRDRRVASRLPVLARGAASEVRAARESHRDRRVVPVACRRRASTRRSSCRRRGGSRSGSRSRGSCCSGRSPPRSRSAPGRGRRDRDPRRSGSSGSP